MAQSNKREPPVKVGEIVKRGIVSFGFAELVA
jgi:hypothetical protein